MRGEQEVNILLLRGTLGVLPLEIKILKIKGSLMIDLPERTVNSKKISYALIT